MSKFIAVTRKTLKEQLRNRRVLFLTLGLPVAFMVIFGLAFKGGGEQTFAIEVHNEDAGDLGANFTALLGSLQYEDGKKVFALTNVTNDSAALDSLKARDEAMFAVIPANFSDAVKSQIPARPAASGPIPTVPPQQQQQGPPPDTGPRTSVTTYGNPGSGAYGVAKSIFDGVLTKYTQAYSTYRPHVAIATRSLAASETTQYDFIVPGLMIFAIINTAPGAAAVLAKEYEEKTLPRIKLTRVRTAELLGGVTLAQFIISGLSVVLMFAAAKLMGFHNAGSLPAAVFIALVASLAVIGLGMVIAAFAKARDEAANIGTLIAVPASFLSGAFFPIPGVALFALAGHTVGVYDLLPTTHAVKAIIQVLTFGQGLGDVAWDVGFLAVLSVAFFLVGVVLYANRRLRPEE
ncbi:MAG: ABC transporter permease [Thermoplasmatota archaeon]